MPLSVDELLRPRYKVIAPYFHSPYNVGDLVKLNLNVPYPSFLCTEIKTYDEIRERDVMAAHWETLDKIETYPHLFQKLEWSEERTEDEMPEYYKVPESHQYKKRVFKAEGWSFFEGQAISHQYENGSGTLMEYIIPATKEQYDTYMMGINILRKETGCTLHQAIYAYEYPDPIKRLKEIMPKF